MCKAAGYAQLNSVYKRTQVVYTAQGVLSQLVPLLLQECKHVKFAEDATVKIVDLR